MGRGTRDDGGKEGSGKGFWKLKKKEIGTFSNRKGIWVGESREG